VFERTAKKILIDQLFSHHVQEHQQPVARESIKLKQIMHRKRLDSLKQDFGDPAEDSFKLIFQRMAGHKAEMPGSGQWTLFD